ncbi:hypothetical protein SNE40_013221 [Patella caerulea]|uniref:Uncharacterized protein n=1 Tax=Patella caerulea TaxID=87958 RepID=A0AAN8JNX3_PATCE
MDTNQTLSDEELLLFSQEMEGESNANTNSDEDLIPASQQAEENLYKANDISDSQSKRFLICSEKDLTECVKGAIPKNTLRRNSWACNTF